ncbi:MAG: asparagine synthase (glutamine-hydrolyzing) [Gemmatimonadaceae bacterium]
MCGIAGIISPRKQVTPSRLKSMTDSLRHRGPDAEGWWCSDDATVGLGSRRLAILDLSSQGHQPMMSADGRYRIVYNGEIYNYEEIRASNAHKRIEYRGHSDTEVVLNHFSIFGKRALEDFDGMFALSIWDSAERELFCARDRFGEKPFYYAHTANAEFLFGSEIKALLAAGAPRSVNHLKLFGYFRNPANPVVIGRDDQTFFEGIYKLESAMCMVVRQDGSVRSKNRYWRISKSLGSEFGLTHAIEEFNRLFSESVSRRLRSDVPVGSNLSGGVDSSAIASVVRELQPCATYNTFSARFEGFDGDEGPYVDLASARAKTIPHPVFPTETDLARDLVDFCYFQDEPVESSSAFAQWSVMRRAAQAGVVVLLDGLGGDEIAAGYAEHRPAYLAELSATPRHAKRTAFAEAIRKSALKLKGVARRRLAHTEFARRRPNDTFLTRGYTWEHGFDVALLEREPPETLNDALADDLIDGRLENYLRYADRNSMAHSREVRLPFLSHRLVEFMFSLPATYKIQDGWMKFLVRKAFEGRIPDRVLWRRKKIGFATPHVHWLGSPAMKAHVRDAHAYLVREGIVEPSWVNTGECNWQMVMAHFLLVGTAG